MGRSAVVPLVCALIAGIAIPAAAQGEQPAQVEKGRTVAAQACATCHTTFGRMLQAHRQTPDQWRDTVYFMIGRGAQVMPDEIEAVVAFLATTGGSRAAAPPRAETQGDKERGK